ncbi:hypothetical protein [Streptomyces sp. NPDC058145]|uniref:hypothetical protein n=1 Tax=Streptomyces sp. NPDC058145 TaxID=3346356 RepID=UPI0036E4A822
MDEHQVDRLAAASVVGGGGVARRDVDDGVARSGGEGEQAGQPVQPVVITGEQAARLRSAQ